MLSIYQYKQICRHISIRFFVQNNSTLSGAAHLETFRSAERFGHIYSLFNIYIYICMLSIYQYKQICRHISIRFFVQNNSTLSVGARLEKFRSPERFDQICVSSHISIFVYIYVNINIHISVNVYVSELFLFFFRTTRHYRPRRVWRGSAVSRDSVERSLRDEEAL